MKMHRFSSLSVKGLGVSLLLTVAPTRAGERAIKASLVPAAVHEAVKRKYPDACVIGYTKETEKGKITYEVTLRVGGHVTDVGVTSEGMIVVEEERIMANELPVAVAKAFGATPHGRERVKRIERVVERGNTLDPRFEILVEDGSDAVELTFDAVGNLVRYEDSKEAPSGRRRAKRVPVIPGD